MVKVSVNGTILYAKKGALLSDVLMKSAVRADHPCGGKGVCKKCLVTINGKKELSCQYRVMSDIDVRLDVGEVESHIGLDKKRELTENMCYMLDLGTTTLALALVSVDNKSIVDVKCCTNSQRTFGADVISRIEYCNKNNVAILQKKVINDVNSLIEGFGIQKALKLYVAGNATMLHIFYGVSPSSIGVAPYTPVFLNSRIIDGKALGLEGVLQVQALPSIHSFAGADIVAGINLVNDNAGEKYNLLVDLGTNAEIALFSRDKIFTTSAAAGPCFEGVNIACGMSATDGAICEFDGGFKTINNKPPQGICGTGLVDVIATLLQNNIIDETGCMACEQFNITEDVFVNQSDVREFQLAKSAVFSGIMALIKKAEIDFDSIENLYISGGFSAKINVINAVKTGLLPKELKEKCKVLNNSCLMGGVKYICNNDNLDDIIKKAEYCDLSLDGNFTDLFMKNMMF